MAHTPHVINLSVDPALAMVWRIQTELQERILGEHPAMLSNEAKSAYIREQAFALQAELFEAMNAVNWKSWASTKGIDNLEEYRSELCADVFRFFINLCLAGDITAGDLIKSYMDKIQTVSDRVGNYDGRTGKCPRCHRDLEDKGVRCFAGSDSSYWWCQTIQDYVGKDGRRKVVPATLKSELLGRCPTCESREPGQHPAVSGGGEVTKICPDRFHDTPRHGTRPVKDVPQA